MEKRTVDLPVVLVNVARWDGPTAPEIAEGWVIANAARPIPGRINWLGACRRGVFYAAGPPHEFDDLGETWRRLDAGQVELVGNAEVERRVRAYLVENEYESPEQLGMSIAEIAECMVPPLPWCERR